MIVFVVGGHGSGKTTAVRGIMGGMLEVRGAVASKRRYPLGYKNDKVFVLGHYEIPSGGADTVRPLGFLYEVCDKWAKRGLHVVLEGIGQAGVVDPVMRLMSRHGGEALYLATPLDVCVESVYARGHTLSENGIRVGFQRAANIARKIEKNGHTVHMVTRETVVSKLRRLTA